MMFVLESDFDINILWVEFYQIRSFKITQDIWEGFDELKLIFWLQLFPTF